MQSGNQDFFGSCIITVGVAARASANNTRCSRSAATCLAAPPWTPHTLPPTTRRSQRRPVALGFASHCWLSGCGPNPPPHLTVCTNSALEQYVSNPMDREQGESAHRLTGRINRSLTDSYEAVGPAPSSVEVSSPAPLPRPRRTPLPASPPRPSAPRPCPSSCRATSRARP
jgi:hypothetical protein